MPLLSVIVATFNRSSLLSAAIESVRNQEFSDYELIVVDDGSTDNTPEVLATLLDGAMCGKLRVLQRTHGGRGLARNAGIEAAQGEYCVFLDSDDLLFRRSLALIAQAISGSDRPQVLLGNAAWFTNVEELAGTAREPLQFTAWRDLFAYASQNHLGVTGTLVARTHLLREAGGFVREPLIGDGADLMLRLGMIPNMVKIDGPAIYAYRTRPENSANRERWAQRAGELIGRYRQGVYPGGPARAEELRKLLARDAADFHMVCLRLRAHGNCMSLYFKTFGFQMRAGNYGYLFKMPLLLARSLMRSKRGA